jgi:hypothetical protein
MAYNDSAVILKTTLLANSRFLSQPTLAPPILSTARHGYGVQATYLSAL